MADRYHLSVFMVLSGSDLSRRCGVVLFFRSLLLKTKDPECQELCASVLKLWKVTCRGNGKTFCFFLIFTASLGRCKSSSDSFSHSACSTLEGGEEENSVWRFPPHPWLGWCFYNSSWMQPINNSRALEWRGVLKKCKTRSSISNKRTSEALITQNSFQ